MKRKIIINNKEHEMQKMTADLYMEYVELMEEIETHTRYKKQDIEAMMLFICKVYGNQFNVDELKDADTGMDITGIILEFQAIDGSVAEELTKRMEKIMKNFQSGK